MFVPNFSDPQFVDANGTGGLNAAMGAVSGSLALLTSGAFAVPGLLYPDVSGYGVSGNVVTIGLGAPWALVTSGGVIAQAKGIQTGQQNSTYSVDFTSLVPATGTVTAYLACSGCVIQENPFPIPGPPPGHPSYNPNYVPTIGYATNVDTVGVYATSGVPNGLSSFALLQVLLTSGSAAVASVVGRQRAAVYRSRPTASVAAGNLTVPNAQQMLMPSGNGQTNTLPFSNYCQGLTFSFINNTAAWTIAVQGGDSIVGFTTGPVSSITLPASGACSIFAEGNGVWSLVACSPNVVPAPTVPTVTPVSPVAPLIATSSQGVYLGASYSGYVNVSFVAPYAGTVEAYGAINLNQPAISIPGSVVAALLIDPGSGTYGQVQSDTTELSMSHAGRSSVASGATVRCAYLITTSGTDPMVDATYHVGCRFTPSAYVVVT